MILVNVTYAGSGVPTYVNLDLVETIEPWESYTRLTLVSGEIISIKEPVEYLQQKINEDKYGFHTQE